MAILDIIEFFDETGEIIVAKIPHRESGEFRLGSQLVVQESQIAFFYRDGACLDAFTAGRHTLSTQNLPVLTKLISLPFGSKSPFRCYVYFVASKTFINLGWGTPTPVLFRDADFRMVSLRAHGAYSIRITKPRAFMNTIVGTRGLETTFAIQEFFRTCIVAKFNQIVAGYMKSILDLPVQYGNIAVGVKNAVREDFAQYGIELVDLILEAITLPPEVQEMINRATGVAAQDADKYRAIATADALRDAAKNTGAGGQGMGAGLGVGLGLGMAQSMVQGMTPVAPPAPAAPAPVRITMDEVKAKLQSIKELKDGGLISDADFEEQKRRILSQI